MHQIGLGVLQYFDDWNGQFFLHHPFNADSLSEVENAESFAEIYWEDKIMPYVNPLYANEAIAKGGVQVADEKIYRCMSDTSVVQPYVNPTTGLIDGITNRTSYLMNSQLSHKTIRYGRWTFPRFQYEIGSPISSPSTSATARSLTPISTTPSRPPTRGKTITTSGWALCSIHGSPGIVTALQRPLPRRPRASIAKPDAYLGMYPGGQILIYPSFYP